MEKKEYNLDSKILEKLENHPNAEEIMKILLEDPDKEFGIAESKNEIIKQQIEKLIPYLVFEITNEDNYFECRVFFDEDYVWFVDFLIEWSQVVIVNFWTSNKRFIADDLNIKLIKELSRMDRTNIKYLGFSILYKLFKFLKEEFDIYSFHITSSKWSIDFYKKFFNFMEEIWEVELLDTTADNIFEWVLLD